MATWWIDEPILLGSSNPSDADLESLRRSEFSVLVCLLDLQEQTLQYNVDRAKSAGWEWHNIPVRDFKAPSVAQLREFVSLVKTSLPTKRVLVHCQGGSGRTGTAAAAYWIAKGLAVSEAVAQVRARRPQAIETSEQEAVLGELARVE